MQNRIIFLVTTVITCLCSGWAQSSEKSPSSNIQEWDKIKYLSSRTFSITFQFKPPISAQNVFIAGSFNGWSPQGTQMQGPDERGYWVKTIDLPEGTYRYKFVVNGDQWFQDTANPNKEDDGHSGFNSIMEIGPLSGIHTTCSRGDGKIYTKGIDFHPTFPDMERIGKNQVKIILQTCKEDVEKVEIVTLPSDKPNMTPMTLTYTNDHWDYYEAKVSFTSATSGFYFLLRDGKTIVYKGIEGFYNQVYEVSAYPMVVSELPYFNTPDWAKRVVWYQIFPERFRNGDTTNDILGTHTPPWISDWFTLLPGEQGDFYSNVYNRFYGGDLKGVLEKLPYLKELGITAIYFNPVFMSPSIHGYDAMDYRHINPHFGYLEDTATPAGETLDPKTWKYTRTDKLFLQLIQESHKNGIKVIVDGVFNHTGDQFWAFKDLLKNGKNSPYKDWYKVIDFSPPVKYQGWWGSQQLPELSQDEKGIVHGPREHIFDITQRWMDPNGDGDPSDGVDGWRLDVADLVKKPFWREWCIHVRKINPEAYISGEIWDRASDWTKKDMFDAVMNYQFARRVYDYFVDSRPEKKMSVTKFDQSLHELLSWYPYNVNYVMQNLLDSHDTDRIASSINNPNRGYDQINRLQDPDSKDYNWHKPPPEVYQKMKLIVLFQMTFPGAPMVWYGDEVGMWGADDPSDRKPMLWQDLEPYDNPDDSVNEDLLTHYKKLIALRNQYESLQTGEFQTVLTDNINNIYVFRRTGKDNIVIILNNSPKEQTVTLNTYPIIYLYGKSLSKFATSKLSHMTIRTNFNIPAWDGVIFLEKSSK